MRIKIFHQSKLWRNIFFFIYESFYKAIKNAKKVKRLYKIYHISYGKEKDKNNMFTKK